MDMIPSAPKNEKAADFPLGDAISLVQVRKDLLRFAMLHLRNHDLAEDIVQDTLMAAYKSQDDCGLWCK